MICIGFVKSFVKRCHNSCFDKASVFDWNTHYIVLCLKRHCQWKYVNENDFSISTEQLFRILVSWEVSASYHDSD